jgi:hypothetical protein
VVRRIARNFGLAVLIVLNALLAGQLAAYFRG